MIYFPGLKTSKIKWILWIIEFYTIKKWRNRSAGRNSRNSKYKSELSIGKFVMMKIALKVNWPIGCYFQFRNFTKNFSSSTSRILTYWFAIFKILITSTNLRSKISKCPLIFWKHGIFSYLAMYKDLSIMKIVELKCSDWDLAHLNAILNIQRFEFVDFNFIATWICYKIVANCIIDVVPMRLILNVSICNKLKCRHDEVTMT